MRFLLVYVTYVRNVEMLETEKIGWYGSSGDETELETINKKPQISARDI